MAALMLQGTGSDVGKSVLVAGLCRALANRGLRVRPFKPQNMSNNAAVTIDGGEIGRAQALQALACRTPPHSDMNPVLLKPQADRTSQLIVHGRVRGTLGSGNFRAGRGALLPDVLESYGRLRRQCDIVIVEGAGSPAEINLRAGDIANMGFARAARVPVVLVGDIDRGGVIAAIVGTRTVIDAEDAAMIKGFVINKFRGDPALFDDGYRAIAERSGWPGLGVVPWLAAAARLPSEDAVILERRADAREGRRIVACPILPRIANFDDLDPLKQEPGVELLMVPPGQPIPAEAAIIVLPGSKATIADLAALRREGWDIDIKAHHRRGGLILGLCGGYQMLGTRIADPLGIEGAASEVEGLGLLDVTTELAPAKTLREVTGTAWNSPVAGYEMHMGATVGTDTARPFARIDGGGGEGAINAAGNVIGTYIHGLLASPALRSALLAKIGVAGNGRDHGADVDAALDDIAAELAIHIDIGALLRIAAHPV
ncbi:cobyric acid synthase [Sphingopyxis alaskensis]|jgi:adenosylcobyric acid synthase|uniref:Cobyric acid synthase n=1 Tax=Sphingopyxis alaskensis (strain DSM 13593 / LMG 18877 / RB2256) TaxID=317655 RepID=COBQ_SPHAL|nr:cobyric acid synthase [Sphingopyxis alaskensis]Q1GPG1.1 RecName: Full=Cobyric acid synthase [Sphingopyxis alaskensis RB2256]ABF54461.1 adenosylcobyric acid synthase (glutamine-hydrolysing) [Sphingopyxis alaskensis RB2256]MCM3417828.1 cobyric acid synthase [Sphingopyxis alaskensis]